MQLYQSGGPRDSLFQNCWCLKLVLQQSQQNRLLIKHKIQNFEEWYLKNVKRSCHNISQCTYRYCFQHLSKVSLKSKTWCIATPSNLKIFIKLTLKMWTYHSHFRGQQGKAEAISLTFLYHFQILPDIRQTSTAGRSPLQIAARLELGTLVFKRKLLTTKLRAQI